METIMNKKLLLLFVCILLFSACKKSTPVPSTPVDSSSQLQDTPSSPTQQTDTMIGITEIALSSLSNTGASGTAILEEQNGYVRVTISTTGTQLPEVQTAAIYSGSCTDLGEIKFPLTSVENGTSTTTLAVSMTSLKGMGPLALQIEKSACGDLPTSPAIGPGLATPAPTPLL